MSFNSKHQFFLTRLETRANQILGKKQEEASLLRLECQLSITPYYDFSFHEKALVRPFYHAINAVRDLITLLIGVTLTLGSLYYDRDKTSEHIIETMLQLVLMITDCLLALASVVTLLTRSIASLFKGYMTKDVPEKEYTFRHMGACEKYTPAREEALKKLSHFKAQEQELDDRTTTYEYNPPRQRY